MYIWGNTEPLIHFFHASVKEYRTNVPICAGMHLSPIHKHRSQDRRLTSGSLFRAFRPEERWLYNCWRVHGWGAKEGESVRFSSHFRRSRGPEQSFIGSRMVPESRDHKGKNCTSGTVGMAYSLSWCELATTSVTWTLSLISQSFFELSIIASSGLAPLLMLNGDMSLKPLSGPSLYLHKVWSFVWSDIRRML